MQLWYGLVWSCTNFVHSPRTARQRVHSAQDAPLETPPSLSCYWLVTKIPHFPQAYTAAAQNYVKRADCYQNDVEKKWSFAAVDLKTMSKPTPSHTPSPWGGGNISQQCTAPEANCGAQTTQRHSYIACRSHDLLHFTSQLLQGILHVVALGLASHDRCIGLVQLNVLDNGRQLLELALNLHPMRMGGWHASPWAAGGGWGLAQRPAILLISWQSGASIDFSPFT